MRSPTAAALFAFPVVLVALTWLDPWPRSSAAAAFVR